VRSFLLTLLVAALLFPLTVRATDVEGDVWGTWTRENSPYNVIGEVRVPPCSTLVIEPGVLVDFKGHYVFMVDSLATLLALGTETDSIFFTAEDTATGWRGLNFFYADSGSQIAYCRLQYADEYEAIWCFSSSPTITNNTICDNSSGGINCMLSEAIISHNIITRNSGSGIFCIYSQPLISHNTISGNSSSYSGGGIDSYNYCYLRISHNVITCNSAGWGGGIAVTGSCLALMSNNTISGNRAETGGGVCFSRGSEVWIYNSILWGDTASLDPEICQCTSQVHVGYCDVEGGWSGGGNIDADPLFADPGRRDFNVRWRSPCIDAGSPGFPLDPDETCSDIGAFYFDQSGPGIVELYPHETPIVIPRQGGELSFDGWVFNFSGQRARVDIWTYLFAPEIGRYGPLDLWNVRIPDDSLGLTEISRRVPEVAPGGDYVFVAYIGHYPGSIVDSSYFYFSKEGEVVGVQGDWTEEDLPAQYALFQNYPNPFNSATTISYQLPISSNVKLEVFDVLGRKVATLVDSRQQAANRSVIWDASDFSSGLYFCKLTAGEFSQTRRMMLVK
jgi:hypothetical protein